MALSDEEKEFLRKLTEEPTSVSADLTPSKTSFITSHQKNFVTVSPIILPTPAVSSDMVPSQSSSKRILKLPTTLGIGFDPTAIEPESGFKPIHQGQGGSIPTLAFSVMDGAERPPVNADLYEKDFLLKRQNILNQLLVNQLTHVSFQIFLPLRLYCIKWKKSSLKLCSQPLLIHGTSKTRNPGFGSTDHPPLSTTVYALYPYYLYTGPAEQILSIGGPKNFWNRGFLNDLA